MLHKIYEGVPEFVIKSWGGVADFARPETRIVTKGDKSKPYQWYFLELIY